MRHSHFGRIVPVLLTLLSLVVIIVVYAANHFGIVLPVFPDGDVPASVSLPWTSSLNLEQSHNTCGAYSAMAYLFIKTGETVDPELINRAITEKYGDNYIYPWGITTFLAKNGVAAHVLYFGFASAQSRVEWIKSKLAGGEPVILIIGNRKTLHYITVVGYKDDGFCVYDSLGKKDVNGVESGNYTVPVDGLIQAWERARFGIFKVNMAIAHGR